VENELLKCEPDYFRKLEIVLDHTGKRNKKADLRRKKIRYLEKIRYLVKSNPNHEISLIIT